MPRISKAKKEKISEQILHYLFLTSPEPRFTADIAREIARDEEFTKKLLNELRKSGLVVLVKKSPAGEMYARRQRWTLSQMAYTAYKKRISS